MSKYPFVYLVRDSNYSEIDEFLGWYHYKGDTTINIISDIMFVIYFSQISKKINTIKSMLVILFCLIYYKCYDLYLNN